jgi:hypothetical protein
MGQQPNIELTEAHKPRTQLEPPPAKRWRPAKPGLITSPDQVPAGGRFGAAGPDAGWALKLLSVAELPEDDASLRGVLQGLMMARAAALGRGPTLEDLEVGLALCGYGYEAPEEVVEKREHWKQAVAHEQRLGQTAVSETDHALLTAKAEQVRWALTRSDGTD